MSDINEMSRQSYFSWTTGFEVSLDGTNVNIAKGSYVKRVSEDKLDVTSFDAMTLDLKPDELHAVTYGLFIALEDGVIKYTLNRVIQTADIGETSADYNGDGHLLVSLVQATITVDGDVHVDVTHVDEDDTPAPKQKTNPFLSDPPPTWVYPPKK